MISPGGLVATLFKTTGAAVAAAVDAAFNYVSLLLNGEPPTGTSTFLTDASTNNLAITPTGSVRSDNFSPFAGDGYYSTYVSAGNRVGVPSNAALGFGTGDFTVEIWVQCAFNGAVQEIIDARSADTAQPFVLGISATGLARTYDGTTIRTGGQLTANTWNHVAWVRASNVNTVYVNGLAGHTWTASQNFGSANQFIIGDNVGTGVSTTEPFTGYMSNLRVVKGTAVYTTNFAVPTTPLTAIANTSLLLFNSPRHVDKSSNALTLTFAGAPKISYNSPIGTKFGSVKFNGTTDYLTFADNAAFQLASADFTIETWINVTALPAGYSTVWAKRAVAAGFGGACIVIDSAGNYLMFVANSAASAWQLSGAATGHTVNLNQWTHLALVRSGSSFILYKNGVAGTTQVNATAVADNGAFSLMAGSAAGTQNTAGYLSNFRFVKGTALYTSAFTPSTSSLTAVTGTSLLTCLGSVTDASTNAFVSTTVGTPSVSYASPFPQAISLPTTNGSAYFNGTTDYVTTPANAALVFGTNNFTFECWFNTSTVAAGNATLFAQGNGTAVAAGPFMIGRIANQLAVRISTSGTSWDIMNNVAVATILPNTWYHVALVRNSNTFSVYLNGVLATSATSAASLYSPANAAGVGAIYANSVYVEFWSGYVSNLRVVNGSALYTSAFTPSATPLTAVANTSLLTLQSPTPASTKTVIDHSQLDNVVTVTGTPGQGTFSPFSQTGWSTYFNGLPSATGNMPTVYTPAVTNLMLGGTTSTIECWFNLAAFDSASLPHGGSTVFCFWGGPGATHYYALVIGTDGGLNLNKDYSGAAGTTSTIKVALNTWYHIAVVIGVGGTNNVYLNGADITSTFGDTTVGGQWPLNFTGSAVALYVGTSVYAYSSYTYLSPFTGYISNFRVVRGTAVYTAPFTPPTSPLTAITGTVALLLQSNRHVDNSGTGITATGINDLRIQAASPFEPAAAWSPAVNGSSVSFNGSTDLLTSPLPSNMSGDFTIEGWVYPTSVAANQTLVNPNPGANGGIHVWKNTSNQLVVDDAVNAQAAFTTVALVNNAWNHFAVVRSGTTTSGYINGVLAGTNTFTPGTVTSVTVGRSLAGTAAWCFAGYMADIRIVNGTAVYTKAFTPPVAPLQPIPGTSLLLKGTPGIVDATGKNDFTTIGSATATTAVKKYGTSSLYFNGTTDYLQSATTADFGTGDFTVEFWMNAASTTNTLVMVVGTQSIAGNTTAGMWRVTTRLGGGGGLFFNYTTGSSWSDNTLSSTNYNDNTWHHIAVTRSGTTMRGFVDGVLVGTITVSQNLSSGQKLNVGFNAQDTRYYTGYIDDLRITKGAARYTANFTPPTAALATH